MVFISKESNQWVNEISALRVVVEKLKLGEKNKMPDTKSINYYEDFCE
jgi:hypothetical protein